MPLLVSSRASLTPPSLLPFCPRTWPGPRPDSRHRPTGRTGRMDVAPGVRAAQTHSCTRCTTAQQPGRPGRFVLRALPLCDRDWVPNPYPSPRLSLRARQARAAHQLMPLLLQPLGPCDLCVSASDGRLAPCPTINLGAVGPVTVVPSRLARTYTTFRGPTEWFSTRSLRDFERCANTADTPLIR